MNFIDYLLDKKIVINYNLASGIEQLVARKGHNLEVAGSSPAPATNIFC